MWSETLGSFILVIVSISAPSIRDQRYVSYSRLWAASSGGFLIQQEQIKIPCFVLFLILPNSTYRIAPVITIAEYY